MNQQDWWYITYKGYKGDHQGIVHCFVIVDLNVHRSSI
jgi:hypothetical protein